jgi:mannosyltransferase OCH1-like enzyme
MNKRWIVVALGICAQLTASSFIYHDFDDLMNTDGYPNVFIYTSKVLNYDGKAFLNLGRLLYNRFNPTKLTPEKKPIIPKVIHQIWIGTPQPPEVFIKYMDSWKHYHPDWDYILWDNERVKTLFPLYNQKFYDES